MYKRPYRVTTDSNHHNPIAPNALSRRFDGWAINKAWVGDITYVQTGEGWLYLACVMDLASRRIVGWSMSDRIKADLVTDALRSALVGENRAPGSSCTATVAVNTPVNSIGNSSRRIEWFNP